VGGAGYTNFYIPLTLGLLSFCLFSCDQSTFPDPPSPVATASQTPQLIKTEITGQPQFLPISGTAQLAGRTIQLEVARTPEQQAKGMMWRKEPLADDRGMAFPFGSARPMAFWMKNCFVPLDMVFILDGKVQEITTAPPCLREPCPIYPQPPVIADTVIELRANWAKDYGLNIGDRITVELN